jgi:hypothetical protein
VAAVGGCDGSRHGEDRSEGRTQVVVVVPTPSALDVLLRLLTGSW